MAAGTLGWCGVLAEALLGHGLYAPAGIAALALFGAGWIACRVLTRDIAERRADEVDEYEFPQRARVRDAGYVAGLAALMVMFLFLSVAVRRAERGDVELLQQAPPLAFVAFLLSAALPTFLFAWRTRNHVDDPDPLEPSNH